MAEELAVLILAAGKGTRMKSDLVKVLHPIMGQPMLAYVLNAVRYLNPDRTVIVVGHQADRVEAAVAAEGLTFVRQEEQLGTGHAAAAAREALSGFKGTVLILSGDVPLLSPQTMTDFLAAHGRSGVPLSVLTVELYPPGTYGRIIRDEEGFLEKIVEARDADPDELAVVEINTGVYAVEADLLFTAASSLSPDNEQKEYYLTDIVGLVREKGLRAAAIMTPEPEEVLGVNDRIELAQAVALLRTRTNLAWMRAGVTMIDPETVYIETAVKLAPDVTIWPDSYLMGRTNIGPGATIGPDCQIIDSSVGAGAVIKKGSFLQEAHVPEGRVIGPLAVIMQEKD